MAKSHMDTGNAIAKPFVKWVGGKRSILSILLDRIPDNFARYHEPFVGGGALFFAMRDAGYNQPSHLSDYNERLAITYQVVKNNVDELIKLLRRHVKYHNKNHYLEARKLLSTESDPVKIAGLFIYLNKTCFNGLYRVNKYNQFNVPMGSYKVPAILDEANLRLASKALAKTTINHKRFQTMKATQDHFYYFDPPYHRTYTGYSGDGFNEENQRELASLCNEIHEQGGYFMASNSDTPFIRKLYKGFKIEVVSASRSVSRQADQRGKEKELLIRNY